MKYEVNEKVYALHNGNLCGATYLGSRQVSSPTGPSTTIIKVLLSQKEAPGIEIELEDRFVFHHPGWLDLNSMQKKIEVLVSKLQGALIDINNTRQKKDAPKKGQKSKEQIIANILDQADRIDVSIVSAFDKVEAFCNYFDKEIPEYLNALKKEREDLKNDIAAAA